MKKLKNFNIEKLLSDAEASGAKSHAVLVGKKMQKAQEPLKKKHTDEWYIKEICEMADEIKMDDGKIVRNVWLPYKDALKVGYREVITQDLMRTIDPDQPKYRIAVDESTNKTYVISKGVHNAKSAQNYDQATLRKMINSTNPDEHLHIGTLCVLKLWMGDLDVKLGNILISTDGKNNKKARGIDGDWNLAELRDSQYSLEITEKDIAHLPFINHPTHNWLDIYRGGKYNSNYATKQEPCLIDVNLPNNPLFRKDVNDALLKIILLPDVAIKKLIHHHTDDKNTIVLLEEKIISRTNKMRQAAIQNKDFQNYIGTDAANKCFEKTVAELNNFKMTGKNFLIDDYQSTFDNLLSTYNKTQIKIFNDKCDRGEFKLSEPIRVSDSSQASTSTKTIFNAIPLSQNQPVDQLPQQIKNKKDQNPLPPPVPIRPKIIDAMTDIAVKVNSMRALAEDKQSAVYAFSSNRILKFTDQMIKPKYDNLLMRVETNQISTKDVLDVISDLNKLVDKFISDDKTLQQAMENQAYTAPKFR